jgi:hypothetical protein
MKHYFNGLQKCRPVFITLDNNLFIGIIYFSVRQQTTSTKTTKGGIMIYKSGYFEVHESGAFGKIVFSDGNSTQRLVTKSQALEIGEGFVGITIEPDEWKIIRAQIHASSLISHNEELEEFCSTCEGSLQELKNKIREIEKNQRKIDGDEWKFQ